MKLSLLPLSIEERPLSIEERPPTFRRLTDTEAGAIRVIGNRARRVRRQEERSRRLSSFDTGMNREEIRATSLRLDHVHSWWLERQGNLIFVNSLLHGNRCPVCSSYHTDSGNISMYYGTDVHFGPMGSNIYTLRNTASTRGCFARILEEYRWHQNTSIRSGTYSNGENIRGLFSIAVSTLASRRGRRRPELCDYSFDNPNADRPVAIFTRDDANDPSLVDSIDETHFADETLSSEFDPSVMESYQENDEN